MSTALALGFVVASFIIYLNLIQPTFAEVRNLRNEQFTKKEFLKQQEETTAEIEALIGTYQKETDLIEAALIALPDNNTITNGLVQLYALVRNTGLTLKGISVTGGGGASTQQAAAGTKIPAVATLQVRPIGSIAFALTLAGTYNDFKNFLSALEDNLRLFDAESVSLSPNYTQESKTYGVNEYSVKVNAYFQKEPVIKGVKKI